MRKRKNRNALKKEEIGEDYCFVCKDGGHLRICDHKQCVKAYHCECVGRDESFLKSQKKWTCNRHSCFVCQKASHFLCYYCPNAVCLHCISGAEFVNFKGKYGFCKGCLKLAILVEEQRDVNSDGERVDFDDCDTSEGLFKGYYMISKEKQFLDADNLRAAKDRLRAGKHLLSGSDSGEFDDDEDEERSSDYDFLEDIRDYKPPRKKKAKLSAPRKNAKSNGLEFCGWGSAPLITFLGEIGADTEQKLSQIEVSRIINKYINDKDLYHPEKKKKKRKIVCDEKLRSIFRKKTLNHNRIYDLLEVHFAENIEESEEEDAVCYSTDDDFVQESATRLESKTEKGLLRKEAKRDVPPSSFASISKQNINLIFLRRSLVQKLSDRPEFENKITGSFVRVKNDPNDFWQKCSHQLVQVTGVKEFSLTRDKSEIILYVTSIPKEISVNLLSDADFPQEECEELRQKMKDGILQQPTVGELEKKARLLHQDITKDWIDRELKKLNPLIDLANEKGRRRELYEYLERRKSLQSPSEQERLLETYPAVIPEATEMETGGGDAGNLEESNKASSKLNASDGLNDNITSKDTEWHTPAPTHEISVAPQTSELLTLEEQSQQVLTPAPVEETRANLRRCDSATHSPSATNAKQNQQNDGPDKSKTKEPLAENSIELSNESETLALVEQPQQVLDSTPGEESRGNTRCDSAVHSPLATSMTPNQPNDPIPEKFKTQEPLARITVELSSSDDDQDQHKDDVPAKVKKQEALSNNLIDLSSSDDEEESRAMVRHPRSEDPESKVWMILGPDGDRRGPHSLSALRSWKILTTYALGCKAWKINESEDDAIPLEEAVSLPFPNP